MTTIWNSKDQEVFLLLTQDMNLDAEKSRQLMSLMKTAKLTIDERYHCLCSDNTTRAGVSNYEISNARYQIAMGLACVQMKQNEIKHETRMSHPDGYIAALRQEGYPKP